MLTKLLTTIYVQSAHYLERRQADARKRRSERALQRLDDRLLDDIGLSRLNDGSIVKAGFRQAVLSNAPEGEVAHPSSYGDALLDQVINQTRRLRHPYLRRRRL